MTRSVLLCLTLAACSPKPEAPKVETKPTPEAQPTEARATACQASASWLDPSNVPPTEVGGAIPVGDETNCDFYTFAWQWFLSDMQMSTTSPGERTWETFRRFSASAPTPQCDDPTLKGLASFGRTLLVRNTKPRANSTENLILPAGLGQATGDALYDQAGNVVLYSASYTENECQASETSGFAPNTTEIKAAWRILQPTDPSLSTYYNVSAVVPGFNKDQPVTLGLVGFHLVINTVNHPEFVWATWEHKNNAPDCDNPAATPAGGWSFTSDACATCLTKDKTDPCYATCKFNQDADESGGQPVLGPTGTPDQVCMSFPDGQAPGGSADNKANIDALNAQLVGDQGLLTALPDSNPLAVFKNYKMIGALWTVDGKPSTDPQAGSLQLANTTLETFFQADTQNCFTCHNYTPGTPATDPKGLCVSHMVDSLVSGLSCSD